MTKRVKAAGEREPLKAVGVREPHYIKAWRKHRQLTQDQLAERLGTTGATISRYESGKIKYTQDFLEACAAALDCATVDLLRGPPDERSEIMQTINRMTVRQRIQAIKMLRIISEQDVNELPVPLSLKANPSELKSHG